MKQKGSMKKILSGFMAAVQLFTAIISPGNVYAAEPEVVPPSYEEVREFLDADEVVTARDLEIEIGSDFDAANSLEGIHVPDEQKVEVTFQEAKNEAGEVFSTEYADVYVAVYYVTPLLTEHPVYQIQRKLVVTEIVPESNEQALVDDAETDTESTEVNEEVITESLETDLELGTEAEENGTEVPKEVESSEETEMKVTELTVSEKETERTTEANQDSTEYKEVDVTEAETEVESKVEAESEMPVLVMEEMTTSQYPFTLLAADSDTEAVPDKFKLINTGTIALVPDSYATNPSAHSAATQIRQVVFLDDEGNSVTRRAFCIQPNLESPPGGTYDKGSSQVEVLDSGSTEKTLAKCLYYMYGGPAWGKTIEYSDGSGSVNMKTLLEENGCSSDSHFYAVTHYVLGYFYVGSEGEWNANSGIPDVLNSTGESAIKQFASYIKKLPVPKSELNKTSVTAEYSESDGVNVSKTITYKALEENTATITLPDGISLVDKETGERKTGKVKITGGTKFYLEAASGITGVGTYTLKCKYAVDFTAMALKTQGKQDVGFSYYSGEKELTFSVEWPEPREVWAEVCIVKKDADSQKELSGAVYGLYCDAACTDLFMEMPATDSKGSSSIRFLKTRDVLYLKEISGPSGYVLDTKVYDITLINDGTVNKIVEDSKQLAGLTIRKSGETLTEAIVTAQGVTFLYTEKSWQGAVYNLYAGADITAPDGTLVYPKGTLIKENLTTGKNGSISVNGLYLGTYLVTEVHAPDGLICKGESKEVILKTSNQTEQVVLGETAFVNERQKVNVTVLKQDKDTKKTLAGAVYGLYAGTDIKNWEGTIVVKKGTLLEQVTTGTNGTGSFTSDIPMGYEYYIKELQAPEGYVRNSDAVYTFTAKSQNDQEEIVHYQGLFENERQKGKILLVKKDKKNGSKPQGDATLQGAIYGVYARKDIVSADGNTVLYKAGAQVTTMTTDAEGKGSVENLYLGNYYIKEITAPVGYLLDDTEYDLEFRSENDQEMVFEKTVTSSEEVKKQAFQIIKAADNGATDAALLKNAGFSAYLVSDLKKNPDDSYDISDVMPVVLTADGKTEMFTDEHGYACSIPLPYGTYLVRETTTPGNFKPVDDFLVTITEHKPTKPQVWRILLDEEFQAKLKIIKKDDETKKPILIPGAEFKVYDVGNKEYVEQVTTYPVTTVHKSYRTDSKGYLILPQSLLPGRYRIEEVTAPEGYLLNKEYVEIMVDSHTAYQMDQVSGDAIIEVSYVDKPVKGELTIKKCGQHVKKFDEVFIYEEIPLNGAVFEVYAAEDLYSADHQTDENGNKELVYASGTLVGTITTDEQGKGTLSNLPLGTYCVKEKSTVGGHVLNKQEITVTLAYKDQETPIVKEELVVYNERQRVSIQVTKKDTENGSLLKGAVFGLYNTEDILSGRNVIVPQGTLLAEMETDVNGKVVFPLDLPLGKYFVKEMKAPDGYVSTEQVLEFDASYQGAEIPVIELQAVMQNQPTIVEFTKTDITTGNEIEGAHMSLLDRDGVVLESWISEQEHPHVIRNLKAGESYILRETLAPQGYLKTTDVIFTVMDTGKIQKVEMQDEVPTGTIMIHKSGETLIATHEESKEFVYEVGNLEGVSFEVYAAENIKAADGVSDDHYAENELVATIITDKEGIAKVEGLPLGRYYVKETGTIEGFVLDKELRYVDLLYQGEDVPVVMYESEWENYRQKVRIQIEKLDAESEMPVEGAVFGLYNAEDILAGGTVIVPKDTLLQEIATDGQGIAEFTLDLPLSKYYVKETKAPEGYVSSEEVLELDASYQGSEISVLELNAAMKNHPTVVEFIKSDITTGIELEGASFSLLDQEGTVLESWISRKEQAHIIKYLRAGETYILRETLAPYGYLKSADIEFIVADTGEVQKVEMKNEVPTATLIINKKGEFLKDVTLLEQVQGMISHFFTYLTGQMAEVTFDVYAAEDIKAADGVSEDYYAKDELVTTITTDTKGIAKVEQLPLGQYYVKELETTSGYVLDEETRYIDLTYRGQEVPVVVYEAEWENNRQKVNIQVQKTESDSGVVLAGAVFGLYAKEDICSSAGSVLIKADTLIEMAETNQDGTLSFIADLPIYGSYYVKELKAPAGYVTSGEIQEFSFDNTASNGELVSREFIFDNQPTTTVFTKSDFATGEEIEGAKLCILDQQGYVVNEWISAKEPHVIEKLVVGETYTMVERKPADGYVTAESIVFTVENTAEIQKHEMLDDVTKVLISKTDITGSNEIKGATLTIRDTQGNVVESWVSGGKPHYIEKLPIGTYTLVEEQAPKGYLITEEIQFEVSDIGEIQTVQMKDETAKGQLLIHKMDEATGRPLEGVVFELRDVKGNVLEELITDAEGNARSRLYEIADYKNGNYKKALHYVLTETRTQEGYLLKEEEWPVEFAYVDDETPIIEVKMELTNQKLEIPNEVPKTGDDTNVFGYVIMMITSGMTLVVLEIIRRKKHRNQ